ncbi:competence protein ComGC [Secundilactobacillus oryzae JCM 18671]|uniref:Competence protein ComGC n=1 Tax=Secundilactobacillus oryzae JCM 18671 TaxID=1291743 RepID=A0A081BIZ5_9LACO|nr:competence type IV pilus major pilin ComGC [Secundilactobacillus oryzae]GAK48013.1 competence protein ComGC [Secundilactobacillus oryzae JCM 18671]
MKKREGFTLIEMAIVLFIISLLILIVIPNIGSQRDHAQKIHSHAMKTVIQTQIDMYVDETDADTVTYPVLEKKGYLTRKQVDEAKREGISIHGKEALQ